MLSSHLSTWETFTHPVGPANMSRHSFEDLTYILGEMLCTWSMNKTESLSNDPACVPLFTLLLTLSICGDYLFTFMDFSLDYKLCKSQNGLYLFLYP